jgi:putative holliday junction resolvase
MPEHNQSGVASNTATQTVLGFDLGLARTGIAVGNTLLRRASPVGVAHAGNKTARLSAAKSHISEWKPQHLVLGLPCHPDGAPHDMTRAALNFAKALHLATALPIWLVDERYSSAIAGVETDADAAAVILQQYFDEGGVLFSPIEKEAQHA